AVMSALDAAPASAVVLGAGYVGLEVAENLVHRGIAVTLVQRAGQVLTALDPELAQLVAQRLEANGVRVVLGQSAVSIGAADVTLADGERIPGELVIAAIGVRPETDLARGAGLE